jgi:hypothetical protein
MMMLKMLAVIALVCFYSAMAAAGNLPDKFIGSWEEMGQFEDKQQEPCSRGNYDTVIALSTVIDGNGQRCKITSIKSGAEAASAVVSVEQICENEHYGNYRKTELWTVVDIGKEQYRISIATRYPDRLMGKRTVGSLSGTLSKRCR